jgi:hypothetical protein
MGCSVLTRTEEIGFGRCKDRGGRKEGKGYLGV